jgi:cytochrome c
VWRLALAGALLTLLPGAARAVALDGAKLFKGNCGVCHTDEPGKNKIGPSLFGVVGRKAGTAPGYRYSDAMKNSGIVWTPEALDKYLTDPRAIPNIKMIFLGIKDPAQRKAIIDYLSSLK